MSYRRPCNVPKDQRCEALLMDSYLMPTNDRCGHYATVLIDGKRLCVKHAQMQALAHTIKTRAAKPIPRMIRMFKTIAAANVRIVGRDEVKP